MGTVTSKRFVVSKVDGLPVDVQQGSLQLTGANPSRPVPIALSPGAPMDELGDTATLRLTNQGSVPIGIDASVTSGFEVQLTDDAPSPLLDSRADSASIPPLGECVVTARTDGTRSAGTLTLKVNSALFTIPLVTVGGASAGENTNAN